MTDETTPVADPHRWLSQRMGDAARDLEDQADPATTYTMSTELALTNVDGAQAASLSMVRGRRQGPHRGRRTVENLAATEPAVALADELQTELDEGPCLQSIEEESITYSPSLGYDERWPRWGPRVVEETGMHSVLSFHLFTHANTLGALNLYSRERDGFSYDDRHDGVALAAHIAVAVAAADRIDGLSQALASRTVIGQATGMLVERFKVTPDVAFSVLARVSSNSNVKVRDIAERLVRTGELPELDARSRSATSP